MVRIYRDKAKGEFVVVSTCLDVDGFIADLSEALAARNGKGREAEDILGILTNCMPIAFKLAGYKAETVREERQLVCGFASPVSSDLVASGGK